jgi:LytS/YehU family sensor histidine kinase
LLALVASGYVFGFNVEPTTAWLMLFSIVLVFPILHGAEVALGYYRQLREKERVAQELRTLKTQAELRALKAQIDPHFFFNTLNTIAQLIHTDPPLAETTVERLAQMFRYTLTGSEREQVPLEEELSFVDDYLEVERARFGERLCVSREIDPGALDVTVPSLILQPLVENAVKHGSRENGDIDVAIQVKTDGDGLTITIADQGSGMPVGYQVGNGEGHGLRNVHERLTKTYGRGLEIRRNEPQGTAVTIRIPSEGSHE